MADKNKTTQEKSGKPKSAADVSKERLARITKTQGHSLRTARRVFKYGAKSFIRNTWLSVAAVAIMVITLMVLSATLIATHTMNTAIDEVESEVDMSIYIKQSANDRQVSEIANRMRELGSVVSVTYTSPEAANNNAIRKLIEESNITDENYIKELYAAPNKIPWTINVHLVNISDTTELENFVNNDTSMRNMLDARPPSYANNNREAIDRIASIMRRVEIVGLAAAGIFAVISILVIFNTIRMAIFNRREEIYMMRLVGASQGFIAGPFLIEASLYGAIAAIIAGIIIYVSMFTLGTKLGKVVDPTLALMKNYWFIAISSLLMAGIIIGIVSALLASRKYLKTK